MNTSETKLIETLATITLKKGDDAYTVHRDVWFDQDFDGSWIVMAMRPEAPEVRGDRPGGSIRVNDPTVRAFLDELFLMLADPDGFGEFENRRES